MSTLKASEIEIVGFNGAPLVECGRSLPVARRKSDGAFCVLNLSRTIETLIWHSPDEVASFADAGQWTKLVAPVAVPNDCIEPTTEEVTSQPMVIYFQQKLQSDPDCQLPANNRSIANLNWELLNESCSGYLAACAPEAAVETVLNDWAEWLLKRFDAMIGSRRDRADLKRIADFALCAARSRTLRWKSFLRYAATQEPEKVQRTFDWFIHPEFPQTTWDSFLIELKTLQDLWSVLPVLPPESPVNAKPVSIASKLRGIANDKPLKLVA